MRKILVAAVLLLLNLPGQAQEKVIHVQKKDGTSTRARMAELKQISFLTTAEGGQGLLVKTSGGETAAVRFEAQPVVTMGEGKLTVTYGSEEPIEFEISDIAEILFGDASNVESISELEGFSFAMQSNGALLRGIPDGVKPRLYTIDGRSLPSPRVSGGQLLLSRSTLGTGTFIVKAGTFTAKIRL